MISFVILGRAAVICAVLDIANIPYQLEVVPYAEFAASKEDKSRFPLGQMPVLTLPDGKIVTQSVAIARYVGKRANLYPEDPLEALFVDEIIDVTSDVISSAPQNPDNDVKKKLREEWAATKLAKFLAFFNSKLVAGNYLVGGKLTIADLFLYNVLKALRSGNYDYVPVDADSAFPELGAYFDFVKADPVFGPHA